MSSDKKSIVKCPSFYDFKSWGLTDLEPHVGLLFYVLVVSDRLGVTMHPAPPEGSAVTK